MVAVIVRVEWPSCASRSAALPDARTTIIVSPMARPKPSTIAAAMPGAAAGRTTRSDRLRRASSRARAPPCGTSRARRGARLRRPVKTIGTDREREADARDERVQAVLGAERVLHPRREHDEREEADDDRRHAGEELDGRLDDLAHAASARYSATKIAAATLSGTANEQRDERDLERARRRAERCCTSASR